MCGCGGNTGILPCKTTRESQVARPHEGIGKRGEVGMALIEGADKGARGTIGVETDGGSLAYCTYSKQRRRGKATESWDSRHGRFC